MNQVIQNYKTGELRLEEVPSPQLRTGGVLVETHYSLVSSGTETTAVREASLSVLGKARARPDHVKKVVDSVRKQGVMATYQSVMNRLDSLTPLGYSMAGVVLEVGADAGEFEVGQRVACGGVGYANHAEVNYVPRNLTVPVPAGVSLAQAACATVGSVAMQGFRQSGLSVGDTVVVIGLGLVGQLYLQIAQAAGCRTIGVDLNPERVEAARRLGAEVACSFDKAAVISAVEALSGGLGADVVALAVGTDSNEPLELAVEAARDRGRLVNIGKAKIDVPYEGFFKKDLSLVFSRSYGPGRYDPTYEEKGIDYPAGYVKWTERRNMEAFLHLVGQGKLDLSFLTDEPVVFEQAESAYQRLGAGQAGLGVLFKYAGADGKAVALSRTVPVHTSKAQGQLVLGCIGAGNYANTKLMPVLAKRPEVSFKTVVTSRGTSAKTAATRFGFAQASTDSGVVLSDEQVNTVLIATPHGSHASLIASALSAGKAVFCEKPLGINEEQLEQIWQAAETSGNTRLQIGFNRRFSPLSRRVKEHFQDIQGPLNVLVRVNAGRLGGTGWVSDAAESGGRMIGEGCHFVDLVSYFVGGDPVEVQSLRVGTDADEMTVLLRYADGSAGTIMYVTSGGARLAKEYVEVHGGGLTAVLDDFKRAVLYGTKVQRLGGRVQDKGQKGELDAFCQALLTGGPMPISLRSLFATTSATLAAVRSLASGGSEPVADAWGQGAMTGSCSGRSDREG